ncbi:MAG: lipocalin family protein [Prevotella sp.]|nr:lipocalin family protein [Prevotella sp.]
MRNKYITFTLFTLLLLFSVAGCRKSEPTAEVAEPAQEPEFVVKNDSMIYGLICDGTSDSVIVLWPFSGDPMVLNSIDAKHNRRIIGNLEIGDWTGVMLNAEDSMEVTMAVNLDQLKGTWTYPVMPVMKDLQHMSKRMQRRMMANMPDSIKATYLVPREYGFTLKRHNKAQPVGWIMRSNSLEDDSPVKYPEVKNYKHWYMSNGRLLLISGEKANPEEKTRKPNVVDTLDFVFMDTDSLVLTQAGRRYSFHRKQNAIKANEAAAKAVEKQDSANDKLRLNR